MSQVKLGSAVDFTINITEEDISQLSASIMSPTGNDVPCLLKTQPDSHLGEPSTNVHTVGKNITTSIKGLVHPKMIFLKFLTHPHVVPNP